MGCNIILAKILRKPICVLIDLSGYNIVKAFNSTVEVCKERFNIPPLHNTIGASNLIPIIARFLIKPIDNILYRHGAGVPCRICYSLISFFAAVGLRHVGIGGRKEGYVIVSLRRVDLRETKRLCAVVKRFRIIASRLRSLVNKPLGFLHIATFYSRGILAVHCRDIHKGMFPACIFCAILHRIVIDSGIGLWYHVSRKAVAPHFRGSNRFGRAEGLRPLGDNSFFGCVVNQIQRIVKAIRIAICSFYIGNKIIHFSIDLNRFYIVIEVIRIFMVLRVPATAVVFCILQQVKYIAIGQRVAQRFCAIGR